MGCHQPIADTGDYAPGGKICWFCVNFPRDLKCQSLSSLTVEIAFKRRKQAIKYQCWCGVNFPRDLKCQILSSLTLEIAFKRRKGFCGCGPKLDKDLTAGVFFEIRLVVFTMFSHRKVQTVRFYNKRFCLLFYFCILNHIISFVTFRSWV